MCLTKIENLGFNLLLNDIINDLQKKKLSHINPGPTSLKKNSSL